jgi:hypothetical protein
VVLSKSLDRVGGNNNLLTGSELGDNNVWVSGANGVIAEFHLLCAVGGSPLEVAGIDGVAGIELVGVGLVLGSAGDALTGNFEVEN